MASGLPGAAYDSGDVTAADADLEAARSFYAGLGVRWGLRVPAWLPWSAGRRLMHQRLMGLRPADFQTLAPPPGLSIERAGMGELDDLARIDAEAFETDRAAGKAWLAALLAAPAEAVTVALARLGGEPVACGYAVAARGEAGPSVMIGGIAVRASRRRRGAGGALSSALLQDGFEQGAMLAQLSPDHDRAARLYARLGFAETAGHDIQLPLEAETKQ